MEGCRAGTIALLLALFTFTLTQAEPIPKQQSHDVLKFVSESAQECCGSLKSDANLLLKLEKLSFLKKMPGFSIVKDALEDSVKKTPLPADVSCFACKFIAKMNVDEPALSHDNKHDSALQPTNLLSVQGGVAQAETDVFMGVMYALFMLWVLRGMYAKLWCDNFFLQERENWSIVHKDGSPGEEHFQVDANYIPNNWEVEILKDMAKKQKAASDKAVEDAQKKKEEGTEDPPESQAGGLKNMGKKLLSWHQQGGFPSDDGEDWLAPIDIFDTIRDHHLPAPHYIRVYCQEWHYSIGWRIMTLIHGLFKSSIEQVKNIQNEAKSASK